MAIHAAGSDRSNRGARCPPGPAPGKRAAADPWNLLLLMVTPSKAEDGNGYNRSSRPLFRHCGWRHIGAR
ncbi:hypothetical protein JKG47_02015 [Acidithiobacillus sp. MC6.1]|nr:hypothetical protein [Acidithiobacillus sp. MC6.1]